MADRKDIETLLNRLENVDDLDMSLRSDIGRVRSSLRQDGPSWDDVRNKNLLFRQQHAGTTRVNGQDVVPLTGAETTQLLASKAPGALPPELDYRALKSLSELQASQAKAAEANNMAQMQADLNNTGSRFYDPVSKDGSPREIQISMGDVVDAPGGNIRSSVPVDGARVIGNKAFLPPPPIKDVSRTPTDYVLNDAGRQAQSALGIKQAPPEIPQIVIDAIMARGGQINPVTGGFNINQPQASGNQAMQRPLINALVNRDKQSVAEGANPQTSFNDLQTSLSRVLQPQAPPPIMPPLAEDPDDAVIAQSIQQRALARGINLTPEQLRIAVQNAKASM